MKKLFVIITIIAFATTVATAAVADSVKTFSQKEYTIIAGADTTTIVAGDTTTSVTFTPADKLAATGKTDVQMINGKETKIKQVVANGQKFWIKGDVDLDCVGCNDVIIEMWCDEDESQDPISAGFVLLMTLVAFAGVYAVWKFVFRG